MPRRNRLEMNYARLEKLIGQSLTELHPEDHFRLKSKGFMDLVIEVLPSDDEESTIISMAHYFVQNGDLCQDPEMTVRAVHASPKGFSRGMLEALTFQQAIPPVYQDVYPTKGFYRPNLRQHLNSFLWFWLRNLENQGHRLGD